MGTLRTGSGFQGIKNHIISHNDKFEFGFLENVIGLSDSPRSSNGYSGSSLDYVVAELKEARCEAMVRIVT